MLRQNGSEVYIFVWLQHSRLSHTPEGMDWWQHCSIYSLLVSCRWPQSPWVHVFALTSSFSFDKMFSLLSNSPLKGCRPLGSRIWALVGLKQWSTATTHYCSTNTWASREPAEICLLLQLYVSNILHLNIGLGLNCEIAKNFIHKNNCEHGI